MATEVAVLNAGGWEQDETESGHIRTSRIDSDLVFIPLMNSTYGTNSGNYGSATVSQQFASEGNPFGTLDGILLNVPSRGSIDGNGSVVFSWMFSGRKIALYWDRYRNSTSQPITGLIDGRAFSLSNLIQDFQTGNLGTASSGPQFCNCQIIPITLQDDGPHQIKLVFPNFTSGSTRQYLLYGYGVEKRVGHIDIVQPVDITRTGVVATASAVTTVGSLGAYGYPITAIEVWNTTGGSINLTITRDNISLPIQAIAAGGYYNFPLPVPVKLNRTNGAGNGQITLSASTTGLQYFVTQRTR